LERHQPNRGYAETVQIVQTAHQALEVTDPITVGVHVGGDRQAIDHGIFVPEIFDHALRQNSRRQLTA
jgi:hypothetical protein